MLVVKIFKGRFWKEFMISFYLREPYWASCKECSSSCIHEYAGYQEGCEGIPGIHRGTCTNCRTTTKINLESRISE
jgi:hypothetical protein